MNRPAPIIWAYWKEVIHIREEDSLLYPCIVTWEE